MGRHAAPRRSSLQHGIAEAISDGTHTADLGGSVSTSTFVKAVIASMRNADVAA